MVENHQSSLRYTYHTAEAAHVALDNIRIATTTYLRSIERDVTAALNLGALRSDPKAELAYLQQTINEHFRAQLPDAFEAVEERWEAGELA